MSKKNLARSALEGGRYRQNRWARRHSNTVVRHQIRALLSGVESASEAEEVVCPEREPVHRSFDDKLAPVFRWLARQVGRPWDKVRAELSARFDARTTAGRHILFCHVIPSVLVPRRYSTRHQPVYVDRHGLLRATTPHRFPRWRPEPRLTQETVDWLGARRVAAQGQALFWYASTEFGAYRQEERLNDADAARFRALPESVRKLASPWAKAETTP